MPNIRVPCVGSVSPNVTGRNGTSDVSTIQPQCVIDMPTKDMKATQTSRTTLELLPLVMISGLMLLAAFSMIVQMDIEMNAQEVNAPVAGSTATIPAAFNP